jgi:hypothetical protein
MSLDSFVVTRPNQQLGTGDPLALVIEEFAGIVEGTVQRRSATEGWLPVKKVTGTATLSKDAIGESTLGKVVPGETPDGTTHQFSKNSVTIDTLCYARSTLPLLDSFQSKYDVRKEIGMEHGKKIAKFKDTAFLVQGIKAALATDSLYGALPGHYGGSRETLAAAPDATDPAKLYAAFSRLFAQMEEKDIDPIMDNTVIFVRPTIFYALMEAEQVINGEYLTSEGTSVKGHIFKAWGVPVMSTANLPNGVIATNDDSGNSVGRLLGANYAGDFSKVVALAMSPKAVLAGETISLTSDVFYDKLSKSWYVDAHLSFAATPDRAEYAGAILLP